MVQLRLRIRDAVTVKIKMSVVWNLAARIEKAALPPAPHKEAPYALIYEEIRLSSPQNDDICTFFAEILLCKTSNILHLYITLTESCGTLECLPTVNIESVSSIE
jgi:hypothetical protein